MFNGFALDGHKKRNWKMAEIKLTFWHLYDFLVSGFGIVSLGFVELNAIQGVITTLVFIFFASVRILLMWEDVRRKRLENKEKGFLIEKKIENGVGVVVKSSDNHFNVIHDLEFFQEIRVSVDRIFESTKADRFLIMKAINGKTDFQFASVLYEQHKRTAKTKYSVNAAGRCVNFKFDIHYNERIKEAEQKGHVDLIVSELPEGTDLKNIYISEGVTHSRVYHIARIPIDDKKDAILYCSIATHEGLFTDIEKIIIKQEIDSIRSETKEVVGRS